MQNNSISDFFSDRNDPESETVDENNNLNRSMSHVDDILNETNNLNRSMSHVDAIFNDPISTYNTDEISVTILNHRKRPLDDDRTIRDVFTLNLLKYNELRFILYPIFQL